MPHVTILHVYMYDRGDHAYIYVASSSLRVHEMNDLMQCDFCPRMFASLRAFSMHASVCEHRVTCSPSSAEEQLRHAQATHSVYAFMLNTVTYRTKLIVRDIWRTSCKKRWKRTQRTSCACSVFGVTVSVNIPAHVDNQCPSLLQD